MDRYGLIGFPLTHSFSQRYFTDKFSREGIDAEYSNFEIEDISHIVGIVSNTSQLRGLNVTIPHKESALAYCRDLDDDARAIGAVNVIDVRTMKGYNTDVIGFMQSLQPLLSKQGEYKALILGTGGASKAVEFGLRKLGIPYILVGRTAATTYEMIDEEMIRRHRLIVNTTPLGMYPNNNTCPDIPYKALTSEHILYDLVYNPETTEFTKRGTAQGATVKNGLEMLHLQAEAAYKIWTQ